MHPILKIAQLYEVYLNWDHIIWNEMSALMSYKNPQLGTTITFRVWEGIEFHINTGVWNKLKQYDFEK